MDKKTQVRQASETDEEHDVRETTDTEELTEALERGEISPMKYTRLRAQIVGTPNLVDGILRPFADLFNDGHKPQGEVAK